MKSSRVVRIGALGAVVLGALALVGCSKGGKGQSQAAVDSLNAAADAVDSAAADTMFPFGKPKPPKVPKVPFNNQPCQSLTAAELSQLGIEKAEAHPDKAPGTLPTDNYCSYITNSLETQVSYMTDDDYQMNQTGNRSTDHQAPADLPGAFYDAQGGLWFAKDGYYVVIAGRSTYKEPVAHIVAGKI